MMTHPCSCLVVLSCIKHGVRSLLMMRSSVGGGVCWAFLLVASVQGFLVQLPTTAPKAPSSSHTALSGGGLHGEGSRFISLSQLKKDELMPRIIQIAGVYPGLTAEELLAPSSFESAGFGRWAYDFSDPEGPQMGTVALPASELLHACVDPVIVIANALSLGVDLQEDEEVESLVLVDRADREFHPNKFFVFRQPDGQVKIQWFDAMPPDWAILGRVMYVTLPFTKKMGQSKTGFMEVDDD